MMDAQVHRGPDDWGLLLPEAVAAVSDLPSPVRGLGRDHVSAYPAVPGGPGAILGARRLSILDLSARGRMPMGRADGRLWITHNGEIYNYRQLRTEIAAAGGSFRSDTDTEAILHGYALWGDEVMARLRGMFAFAVFEVTPHPRLFLARDRFGIKPLYYYQDRERFIFASEVRALPRSGLVPDEANAEARVRFLQLGSVPAPQTTVKDVWALPAGHCLVVDARSARLRSYWNVAGHSSRATECASVSREEAVGRTRDLLEESVNLHLVSDVPLGVFLSGGIDSSTLVAVASRFRDGPLTTLSVTFDEPAYNEAPYARRVAELYRTDHREVALRLEDVFGDVRRIFSAMDQPTVDGVNSYFVAEAARRAGVTVVLSGTGGDEVFLGYEHLRRSRRLDRARAILAALPPRATRGLIRVAAAGGGLLRRPGLEKLAYLERPTLDNLYLVVRGLFSPGQVRDLLGIGEAELDGWGPALPPDERPARSAIDTFGLREFTHYLQDQLLKDTDVMSMAHSVETRLPFLDHRLVEYVVGLPETLKVDRTRPKPMLLDALGEALPRVIWDRPKMGFVFPFEPWLRRTADEIEPMSLEGKLLQRKAVERVWAGFKAGRLHWSRPWALVVLAHFDAGWRRAGSA
jgi:asparagine synthase (glutamine-hydrolysing)